MRTLSLFIHDDRYTVPTLQLVLAAEGEDLRDLARRRLLDSNHHRRVEVREGDRSLVCEERPG